jgi:CheY-like chemotaxis protein
VQRILIVDDVLGVRESLRVAFQSAGFDVVTAQSGRRGLELLAASDFDVVVTDIWMPEMDGLELIKRMRAEKPAIRVFAITGGGPRMTIESASSLAEVWGAERVFVKPFDESDLVAAIQSLSSGNTTSH